MTEPGAQPSAPSLVNSETEFMQESNPGKDPECLAARLLAGDRAKDSRNMTEDCGSSNPAETESIGTAAQRNRQPGLSKRLRASLDGQKQDLQDNFESCHQSQCQLDWYSTQLASWIEEHVALLLKLSALEDQNKRMVMQLQEEDARVKEMQEEGRQDMQQLAEMMVTLDNVTTPQDAFVAVNNADCYCEEAERWSLMARMQFPDQGHIPNAAKVSVSFSLNCILVRSKDVYNFQ